MSVRISDTAPDRLRFFKEKLRDHDFLNEFLANPIQVLDREAGITINPDSRMAREFLDRLHREGEGYVSGDYQAHCLIVKSGDTCIIAMLGI
jgi:hypothetical protein